jgi:photosystem II stability/assembly factor-like uncharacterized protein
MKSVSVALLFVLATSSHSQDPFWQHLDSTHSETVTAMTVNQAGHIFVCFAPGRLYKSTDNGQLWTKMWDSTLNTMVYSMAVDSNGYIFAATSTRTPGPSGNYVGRLICSTDEGISWSSSDSGITGVELTTLAIGPFNMFFAGSWLGRIYRSTDDGGSWMLVRSGTTGGEHIDCLAFDSSNHILAGSFAGDSSGQVYSSTDSGFGWSPVAPIGRSVYSLAVGVTNMLYAGTYDAPSNDGGIFRSTNHGADWSQVGLQNMSVSSILIAGTRIFAGTYGNGIYQSSTGGSSWDSASSGLNNLNVRILLIAPNRFLFAGTIGGGVYRTSQPVTGIEESKGIGPEIFALKQNYPNPFNPTTTIRYELAGDCPVALTVFNVLGQRVAQLVQEQQQRGYYQVRFDGNALSSGLYVYRLQAGKYVEMRKMLLLH